MKRLITASALAIMSLSAGAQKYSIHGSWNEGRDGDTIFLVTQTARGMVPSDTAILKNHQYSLTGSSEVISMVSVYGLHGGNPMAVAQPVFVLDGADITLNLSLGQEYEIAGEANNEVWAKVNQAQNKLMTDNKDLLANRENRDAETVRRLDLLNRQSSQIYYDAIMQNMPLPICGMMMSELQASFSDAQKKTILNAMAQKMPNDPYYQHIVAQMNAEAETAVGKPYKELALINLKGNMVRLSEVVKTHKVTLIDFWASWCRPCLMEMPNVKNIYNEYGPKGLEIYGVSLDENQIAWQGAIQKFQLPWIHVSDLKGWGSQAAKAYNIRAIPATVLIDQNGVIIGKNLRGNELKAAIEKALK